MRLNYVRAIARLVILACLQALASSQVPVLAPTTPVDVAQAQSAKPEKTEKKKSDRRGSFVVAPLPIASPALGTGVIPFVAYIFPFSKDDNLSPPSTIGVGGLVTSNGSRGFGAGGQLFFKKNTYEATGVYVHGNVNYDLYGGDYFSATSNLKVPLNQSGSAFFGEIMRRMKWKIFAGPRFSDGHSFLTLAPTSSAIPALPPDLGIHTTLRAVGIHLIRDTRPNHFYPTAGAKLEFTADFFSQSLGSKYSFQSYKLYADKYWSLSKKQVLAYDLFVCDTAGAPPFYGNCIYGTHNELRGYTAGRYFDRHMAATQLEYRLSLPKGLGLAAFGGLGEVIPGASQIFATSQFLPAAGGGPRYELSSKYHVNLRADFAKGRDSWTWSMGVGEAF